MTPVAPNPYPSFPNKDVTVITSTIGRKSVFRANESVLSQDYGRGEVRHHIYLNGERKWGSDHTLSDLYSIRGGRTQVAILSEETGDSGVGPGCGAIFAAAPFLTNSEFLFFLNDDDFFDPNHVSSLVSLMTEEGLDWAYSLRRFVDDEGPIADDDWDSLGHWRVDEKASHLVDNSSFAMRNRVARRFGPNWLTPHIGDRAMVRALFDARLPYGCSGQVTSNYRVGGSAPPRGAPLYDNTAKVREVYGGRELPWRRRSVFRFGPR